MYTNGADGTGIGVVRRRPHEFDCFCRRKGCEPGLQNVTANVFRGPFVLTSENAPARFFLSVDAEKTG